MLINKVIVKNNILISFDDSDHPMDIIDLSKTEVGNVYLARVEKVLNDLDASIVQIPDISAKGFIENKKLNPEAFLVRHSEKKPVCQADEFYIRIIKDKKDSKPYTCTFVKNCDDSFENKPIDYFLNLLQVDKSKLVEDSFDVVYVPGIIEKALNRHVYLKNDGDIIIESTSSMNTIDVNTGKGSKKRDKFETNRLALIEVARQIRLRNLSGIIVVDLLKDMSKDQKNQLIEAFKEAAAGDYALVNAHGFTKLGLFEITRERILSPLYEIFEK